MNGTVTLSGENVPNIDCAKMDDEETITNNNSCKSGMFVSGDTLQANSHNDYYVMVYIKNLDEPQYDSGEFNGTITFTTEDGKRVKGRFTKPFNLAQHITNLYNDASKTTVTNNEIDYNYATSVSLMNDRLGGTSTSVDGGNIRYYGAEPNNWVDIGDKTEVEETKGNWLAIAGPAASILPFNDSAGCNAFAEDNEWTDDMIADGCSEAGCNYTTIEEFCSTSTVPVGTPILWRIIGVFDGKLRVMRNENIGFYSFDTSTSDINGGIGISEWSQSDIMKLLNPGYETNIDEKCVYNSSTNQIDCEQETGLVNNSLWWNSGSGNCYNGNDNQIEACDFTNSGLSDSAKDQIVDQEIFLGEFRSLDLYANEAYEQERSPEMLDLSGISIGVGNTHVNGDDYTISRKTRWTGKVGLPYLSDYGYASDLSNCTASLNNYCQEFNWMSNNYSFMVNRIIKYYPAGPTENGGYNELDVYRIYMISNQNDRIDGIGSCYDLGGNPTLLLDAAVLAESGNGSKETPYVVAY